MYGNCMKFPKVIKSGGVAVTIYRIAHKRTKSGWIYSVAYYDQAGDRKQKQFTSLAKATDAARLKADQLAAGKVEATNAGREDLDELQRARELAGDTPLIASLEELRRAREIVGNGSIIEACRQWKERHAPSFERITVADAIDRFIAAKKKQGVDTVRCYQNPLGNFKKATGDLMLDTVSTMRLQKHLNGISMASTRNTHRKRIVALFRWARKTGYLPRDVQTEAELTDRAVEDDQEVGTITAETFEALLRWTASNHPGKLSSLVLSGFCGLRRSEVQSQDWKDIHLDRGHLRVTKGKKGTPARRLVPVCDAAQAWLAKSAQPAGPVCPDGDEADQLRTAAVKGGFSLPANCLRHSFISHRVAATGDANRTALESGNSAKIIFRHYLELFTEAEGKAWFGIGVEADRDEPAGAQSHA